MSSLQDIKRIYWDLWKQYTIWQYLFLNLWPAFPQERSAAVWNCLALCGRRSKRWRGWSHGDGDPVRTPRDRCLTPACSLMALPEGSEQQTPVSHLWTCLAKAGLTFGGGAGHRPSLCGVFLFCPLDRHGISLDSSMDLDGGDNKLHGRLLVPKTWDISRH